MTTQPGGFRWAGLPGLILVATAILGCAGPGGPAAASPGLPSEVASAATSDAPVGVAVIGHSGATGYDSDPAQPGVDVVTNSWATGTNPDVRSIYARLLATDPTIDGHATNLAIDGSDVTSLIDQATRLTAVSPPPKLVLIQTIDNDMQCDGTDDANVDAYRTGLAKALDILVTGLPASEVFIVSQWGDVKTYDRVVAARSPDHLAGDGPCDTVDPDTGQLVPAKEQAEQAIVDAYWNVVTEVCGRYPACRTDGGALQRMDLVDADVSEDLNHLSIAGHAKMAAAVWAVLGGGH